MTINNPEEYLASIWDWGCFDGCFGDTNIKVTDIDGLVERNGHFLLLETKKSGVEVPEGQRILFDRLVKTGYFTVVVIWGRPGEPEKIITWGKKGIKEIPDVSMDVLKGIATLWFEWANRQNGKGIAISIKQRNNGIPIIDLMGEQLSFFEEGDNNGHFNP